MQVCCVSETIMHRICIRSGCGVNWKGVVVFFIFIYLFNEPCHYVETLENTESKSNVEMLALLAFCSFCLYSDCSSATSLESITGLN